jgi:two-component system cell cycle sensor histidine kinase PleC
MTGEHHPLSADARAANDAIAFEQLRLALTNLRRNVFGMPVFAAIIAALFWHWVALPVVALWYLAVVLAGIPIAMVAFHLPETWPAEGSLRAWSLQAIAANVLSTASFTAFGFLFWVPGNDQNNLLILLVLGASLSSNNVLVGTCLPLTIVGYVCHALLLVGLPLRHGGTVYDMLAVLSAIYVGYMGLMSKQTYSTVCDMLRLRSEKDGLIDALAASKEQSDEARIRAEAASRAKSDFLAGMSHELRTPLNAILGFSEMIATRSLGANLDKHAEYGQFIHHSGHHLLALINDILDLAKIEAGQHVLREADFDLTALIAECVELMGVKAGTAAIVLGFDSPHEKIPVRADERAIRQIVLNLLSNAIKFTPRDGKVTAFLHAPPGGEIAFGVADTGRGIHPDDQHLVFENFGQGRHEPVAKEKGTGLGLPIVKGLAIAHGGRVALESAVGEGTRVTVTLPASRNLAVPTVRAAS